MPWFRTKTVRAWLTGAVAFASAAISLAALAQVTGTDAEQRLALQQRHMERFESFLRDYAAAAESGDCARFRTVDASYFNEFGEFREMTERDFPPGWLRSAYNRKDTIYKRAECSRFLPAQTALPAVRAKEPGWDPDLYQHFRERVENLQELRNDRLCDGPQGYNAGLESLRVDVARSFTQASNAGGDQWRSARPVLEHFDNWHEVAVLLGCDQQIVSHTGLPPIAGTYRTSFGAMTLTESGGTYDAKSARLDIVLINGNTVQGYWTQDDAAERCDNGQFTGRFRFTFTAEGFTGVYGRCEEQPAREWNGVRDDQAWASRPSTPAATPSPERPLIAAPAPQPTPVAAAGPAATDPRFPVNAPGFTPLPPVKLAEAGWSAALYRELSERVARIGGLREQGRCDDYEYSMDNLSPDLTGELEYARGLGTAEFQARRKVVEYFRSWRAQAVRLGCVKAAPAPYVAAASAPQPAPPVAVAPPAPPAPRRPSFVSLPDVRPIEPGWDALMYQQFRDSVESMARLRERGDCRGYDFQRASFATDIARAKEFAITQRNIDSNDRAYYARFDVINYFRYWIDGLREAGCTPG